MVRYQGRRGSRLKGSAPDGGLKDVGALRAIKIEALRQLLGLPEVVEAAKHEQRVQTVQQRDCYPPLHHCKRFHAAPLQALS